VLVAVLLSAKGWNIPITTPTRLAAGTASGFMGSIAAIGGPPMALLYQHRGAPMLRATLSGYGLCVSPMILGLLAIVGEFRGAEVIAALTLMPGAFVGFLVSSKIAPRIDPPRARVAVLTIAGISSLVVIAQALL
jgi:hypothetical protein